jgi:ParB family chromosome partitioning protein
MAKEKDLLSRFGSNLAESMGAGRNAAAGSPATATPPPAPPNSGRHEGVTRLRAGAEIAVDRIAPDPNQPRTEFDPDAVARLAESLKSHGQLQPICVRWDDAAGRYVIVTGERRWRAAVSAGRPTVTAVILDGPLSDSQVLEMQLIENALREDLKPVEQARAYRTLMDRNGWPALKLAEVLHLHVGTVTRALALLELPGDVRDRVESGALAPSVAYEISKVSDPAAQRGLAERVVSQGLSRAETIARVRQSSKPSPRAGKPRVKKPSSRVFRTASARVTVELRKAGGPEDMLAAVREVARQIEAELRGKGEEAA